MWQGNVFKHTAQSIKNLRGITQKTLDHIPNPVVCRPTRPIDKPDHTEFSPCLIGISRCTRQRERERINTINVSKASQFNCSSC